MSLSPASWISRDSHAGFGDRNAEMRATLCRVPHNFLLQQGVGGFSLCSRRWFDHDSIIPPWYVFTLLYGSHDRVAVPCITSLEGVTLCVLVTAELQCLYHKRVGCDPLCAYLCMYAGGALPLVRLLRHTAAILYVGHRRISMIPCPLGRSCSCLCMALFYFFW